MSDEAINEAIDNAITRAGSGVVRRRVGDRETQYETSEQTAKAIEELKALQSRASRGPFIKVGFRGRPF